MLLSFKKVSSLFLLSTVFALSAYSINLSAAQDGGNRRSLGGTAGRMSGSLQDESSAIAEESLMTTRPKFFWTTRTPAGLPVQVTAVGVNKFAINTFDLKGRAVSLLVEYSPASNMTAITDNYTGSRVIVPGVVVQANGSVDLAVAQTFETDKKWSNSAVAAPSVLTGSVTFDDSFVPNTNQSGNSIVAVGYPLFAATKSPSGNFVADNDAYDYLPQQSVMASLYTPNFLASANFSADAIDYSSRDAGAAFMVGDAWTTRTTAGVPATVMATGLDSFRISIGISDGDSLTFNTQYDAQTNMTRVINTKTGVQFAVPGVVVASDGSVRDLSAMAPERLESDWETDGGVQYNSFAVRTANFGTDFMAEQNLSRPSEEFQVAATLLGGTASMPAYDELEGSTWTTTTLAGVPAYVTALGDNTFAIGTYAFNGQTVLP